VVRGVAHRQHAFGQEGKALRQQIVFEEVLFDQRIAAKIGRHPRREEAVAQPTGALARRTIHEDVQSILAKGLAAGGEQPVEALIARGEVRAPDVRVDVLAKVDFVGFTLALEDDELQVLQRVWLDRLELIRAFFHFNSDDVHRRKPFEIDIAVGKDFVKDEIETRLFWAAHLGAEKTGQVGAEVYDVIGVLIEPEFRRSGKSPIDMGAFD
jgi:hypothetical protein